MEKYKANLKKHGAKAGNLKGSHSHANAEKRISNSDRIACGNNFFDDNSFADNESMKFPLRNESNIKSDTVKFKKNKTKYSYNQIQIIFNYKKYV